MSPERHAPMPGRVVVRYFPLTLRQSFLSGS